MSAPIDEAKSDAGKLMVVPPPVLREVDAPDDELPEPVVDDPNKRVVQSKRLKVLPETTALTVTLIESEGADVAPKLFVVDVPDARA